MSPENLKWIIGGIMVLVVFIGGIIINSKPEWKFRVIIVCVIVSVFLMILPWLSPTQLIIINPSNNAKIIKNNLKEITIKDNDGKQILAINIPVSIKGRNVPKGKYVSLMTSVDGTVWWANGGSIPTNRLGVDSLTIDKASFGTAKDGNTSYMLYLSITDEELKSGINYVKNSQMIKSFEEEEEPKPKPIPMPNPLLESETIQIEIEKY